MHRSYASVALTSVVVVIVVLTVAALAVIGYRIGTAPGALAITERDRRLQSEQAEQAAFRLHALPGLRSDRYDAVESLAAVAVRMARQSLGVNPSMSATEALAESVNGLDQLERDATGATIGPVVHELVACLVAAGVLDDKDTWNRELTAMTPNEVASNPGLVIRIIGVADINLWP